MKTLRTITLEILKKELGEKFEPSLEAAVSSAISRAETRQIEQELDRQFKEFQENATRRRDNLLHAAKELEKSLEQVEEWASHKLEGEFINQEDM